MSPLEQRDRRLLTWLPEPARSRWADDMTETYLRSSTRWSSGRCSRR